MPLRGRKSGREGGSLPELVCGQGDGAGLGMQQFLVWKTTIRQAQLLSIGTKGMGNNCW